MQAVIIHFCGDILGYEDSLVVSMNDQALLSVMN